MPRLGLACRRPNIAFMGAFVIKSLTLNYTSVGSTVSEAERRPWGALVGGLMVRFAPGTGHELALVGGTGNLVQVSADGPPSSATVRLRANSSSSGSGARDRM
jgi:hypothetical protein